MKNFIVPKSADGLSSVLEYLSSNLRAHPPLIGVCGGTSIAPVLEALRLDVLKEESVFRDSNLFMIDERLVPSDHADSNIRIVREGLGLATRDLPLKLHEFNTNEPEKGIVEYTSLLQSLGGVFDVIFLGVGEDAHVAGLFPGLSWEENPDKLFFTFSNSPKPPPIRMSGAPHVIKTAKTVVLLFFGENKKDAYDRFVKNEESENACPVLLAREAGSLVVVKDYE